MLMSERSSLPTSQRGAELVRFYLLVRHLYCLVAQGAEFG